MDDDEQRVRATLRHNEKLLWVGRPDPRVIFAKTDVILVPVTLIYIAFIVSIDFGSNPKGGTAVLLGILFGLIALYALIGRFIVKYVQKRRTIYALTDDRAITLLGPLSKQSAAIGTHAYGMSLSRNGHHLSVTFGQPTGIRGTNFYANSGLDFMTRTNGQVAFYDVADVAGLEAAITTATAPD